MAAVKMNRFEQPTLADDRREAAAQQREDGLWKALAPAKAAYAQCMIAIAIMRIQAIGNNVPDDLLVDAQDCVKAVWQQIQDKIEQDGESDAA